MTSCNQLKGYQLEGLEKGVKKSKFVSQKLNKKN